MPIYEYVCRSCGDAFEHLARSMNGREKPHCPSCDSAEVERQHSTFAARQGATRSSPPPGPCGSCQDGVCPMRMPD